MASACTVLFVVLQPEKVTGILKNSGSDGEDAIVVERLLKARREKETMSIVDEISGIRDEGMRMVPSEIAGLCAEFKKALMNNDSEPAQRFRKKLLDFGAGSVAALEEMINCGDIKCELEAMRLLLQINDERGLTVALGKVLTVDDKNLAEYLDVFGECRDTATICWLVAFLGRADHTEVRDRVLRIIQSMNDSQLVSELAAAVEEPTDSLHGADALLGLARAGRPLQVVTLIEIYNNTGRPDIQRATVYALANTGMSAAVEFLADEARKPAAIAEVCLNAMEGIKSTYAQETLIKIAFDRFAGENVRAAAIQALSTQDSERVKNALGNLMGSDVQILASAGVATSETLTGAPAVGSTSQAAASIPEVREERWF